MEKHHAVKVTWVNKTFLQKREARPCRHVFPEFVRRSRVPGVYLRGVFARRNSYATTTTTTVAPAHPSPHRSRSFRRAAVRPSIRSLSLSLWVLDDRRRALLHGPAVATTTGNSARDDWVSRAIDRPVAFGLVQGFPFRRVQGTRAHDDDDDDTITLHLILFRSPSLVFRRPSGIVLGPEKSHVVSPPHRPQRDGDDSAGHRRRRRTIVFAARAFVAFAARGDFSRFFPDQRPLYRFFFSLVLVEIVFRFNSVSNFFLASASAGRINIYHYGVAGARARRIVE